MSIIAETLDDEVAGVAYVFDPHYEAEPKVSAFPQFERKAWPYRYTATLELSNIAGGIPTNPTVAEDWIKSKLGAPSDEIIAAQVAETMKERGLDAATAAAEVAKNKTLTGFKIHPTKGLYIEGRQLKACLKEATSIAVAADKIAARGWGRTNKGIWGFMAEHVFVEEDRLYLGRSEPDEVVQRFVSTWRGTGIHYEEVCHRVTLKATVKTDYGPVAKKKEDPAFDEEFWAMVWLTAQEQGLGAARSQGFGRFVITGWEREA